MALKAQFTYSRSVPNQSVDSYQVVSQANMSIDNLEVNYSSAHKWSLVFLPETSVKALSCPTW